MRDRLFTSLQIPRHRRLNNDKRRNANFREKGVAYATLTGDPKSPSLVAGPISTLYFRIRHTAKNTALPLQQSRQNTHHKPPFPLKLLEGPVLSAPRCSKIWAIADCTKSDPYSHIQLKTSQSSKNLIFILKY